MRAALFALAVASLAHLAVASPPGSEITDLPGAPVLDFAMHSGYVPVAQDRALFYWLVGAKNASSTDLVVWFTGGPGCSSLLALMTELGPFRVSEDASSLSLNPYAWNANATVVFVESPAGVGFSAVAGRNYTTGDNQTAADAMRFVLGFLKAYPELGGHRLLIAGESYAGHYVPQLVDRILDYNAAGGRINLRAMLAGNPSTDHVFDGSAYYPFMHAHAMIGDNAFAAASAACNGSFAPPHSAGCSAALAAVNAGLTDINPYSIIAPCAKGKPAKGGCLTQHALLAAPLAGPAASLGASLGQTYVPCMNYSNVIAYMNRDDVRRAVHADPDSPHWDICSQHLAYTQYAPSVLPIYAKVARSSDLHVLVYSGDVDSCVPFPGTQAAIDSLGLALAQDWAPWSAGDQVGGFRKVFASPGGGLIEYDTVRGAGHMVPAFKPDAAIAMFERFRQGIP